MRPRTKQRASGLFGFGVAVAGLASNLGASEPSVVDVLFFFAWIAMLGFGAFLIADAD